MQITYVPAPSGSEPLIRIEMSIEEARELEKGLMEAAMQIQDAGTTLTEFIGKVIRHLDTKEIPAMPGLQESIDLIDRLRKLLDGRADSLVLNKEEVQFAVEYIQNHGRETVDSYSLVEDIWNYTFTLGVKRR